MPRDVVIVSGCRTPIGEFGGSLKDVKGPHLGAIAMKEAVKRAKIDPKIIGDIRFGCCLEDNNALNIARVAALLAGLPDSIPAVTVNRVCISAMEATLSGAMIIQSGFHDVVLVGGVESMSNVPYILDDARWGARLQDKTMTDALIHGLHSGSHYVPYPADGGKHSYPNEQFRNKPYIMGMTAEFLAMKYKITRQEADEVALRSHNNVEQATKDGSFKDEMIPVVIKDRKKGDITIDKDEHFRPGMTMEQLIKLPPAFMPPNGVVTAGNASGLNDGAAAMIIMSADKAKELGLKPLAKISAMGMGACEPEHMGISPAPAVRDLLKRSGMTLDMMERIEVNEAFATQYIACEKELGLKREITNVHGSGIGLGHPVGCTGARLIVTLMYELMHSGKKRGMATLCGGGGVSMATVIDKL